MGVCSYGEKQEFEEATLKVTPRGEMGNEMYDDRDELPAAQRVDISEPDLMLLELAARAIGAVRVEVVDGEGYVNLYWVDGSVVHSWNPLIHSDNGLDLAVRMKLSIDIRDDADLWDIATIATYLKRSELVVREGMACLPDFPKAIRLPSTRSARGQALYRAKDVINWAARYQDKN
jgi:hypothetical protein